MPGDYLVTLFSFADLLDGEIQVIGESWKVGNGLSRFLRNWLGIVPASTKSSLTQVSERPYKEPKSDRWNEECHNALIKLSMFILLILLYSTLAR